MIERNVIQTTFDEFGRITSGEKKSGSWYWRSAETIIVLNLQKSQYGPRYYINLAIWLLAVGPAIAPKSEQCHIQTRLERLVPPELQDRLSALLDLDNHVEREVRHDELLDLFGQHVLPVRKVAATLNSLRSAEGRQFVKASLVDGEGQQLLAAK